MNKVYWYWNKVYWYWE